MASTSVSASAAAAFDRSLFDETLALTALRIPAKRCSVFMQRLDGHIFHRARIKPIKTDPAGDAAARILLLAESVGGLELSGLPAELREFVRDEAAEPVMHELRLGYEHLTADQALRRLLPAGMEVPSAFEQVGHVAHVNLRDEQLPFKEVIGRVLLEKNSPRIRTVVNKVESITNQFRVFPMEVLAGEPSLRTSVRENGARFELDFADVYWNSRLEGEHKRIIRSVLSPSDVVADVFAGIGPFAIPAALRGCRVYANDLNPKSHEWLAVNVAANKVGERVTTYNLDGRDNVRTLLRPAGEDGSAPALQHGYFGHVLMNLPASALTFLDVFVGAFHRGSWAAPLPTVHCYCFSKAEDPEADVVAEAERVMGCKLPGASASVVRDVSPNKLMMCLRFTLPEEAWAPADDANGELPKRQRTDGGEA